MSSSSEPGQPDLPFPVFRVSSSIERYFLYDVNTITWLRKTHHILGVLVGTLPQIPQQNVFLGLPLELMPEEARLLTEKGLGYIVDDQVWHKEGLQKISPEQKKNFLNNLAREGKAAAGASKSKALDRSAKAFKSGKAHKKSSSTPSEKQDPADLHITHKADTQSQSDEILKNADILAQDPVSLKYAMGQAVWADFSAKAAAAEAEKKNGASAFVERKRSGGKDALALPVIKETWHPVKVADDGGRKLESAITSTSSKGGSEASERESASEEVSEAAGQKSTNRTTSTNQEQAVRSDHGVLADVTAPTTTENAPGASEEEPRGTTTSSNLQDLSGLLFSPNSEAKASAFGAVDGDLLSSDLEAWAITPTTSYPPLIPPPKDLNLPLPTVKQSSYALYKHLHEKEYYMSPGLRFGCEFLVYPGDPLRFHSHFLGIGAEWDEEIDLIDLVGGGRLGTGVKKGWLIGGVEEKDQPPKDDAAQQPKDDAKQEPKDVEPKDTTNSGEAKVRTFCVEWSGM